MTSHTLVLLRHGKAERPPGVADVDRPLTDRGHADAGAAGAWLSHRGHLPDLVICSPAKRTRQTWHGLAFALPAAPVVRYEKQAYSGGAHELLALVAAAPEDVATLLVIGHNPAVSLLSALLDASGGGASDADRLRPCGLAVHQISGPWRDCGRRTAPLAATHTARA